MVLCAADYQLADGVEGDRIIGRISFMFTAKREVRISRPGGNWMIEHRRDGKVHF